MPYTGGGKSVFWKKKLLESLFLVFFMLVLVTPVSKAIAFSGQTSSRGAVSVTASVPLLPEYARLVSERSTVIARKGSVIVRLLGPDDMPVRNRDVAFIFTERSDVSSRREVFARTDVFGESSVPTDAPSLFPGVWKVQVEAVFGIDRVVVSDAASVKVPEEDGPMVPEGAVTLVLLGRSLYTDGGDRSAYGKNATKEKKQR